MTKHLRIIVNVFKLQLEEIHERGYNASLHTILSEDVYVSTVIQIWEKASNFLPKKRKEPVLVFQGLGHQVVVAGGTARKSALSW